MPEQKNVVWLLAAASRWMSDLGRESRYLKREKEVLEQLVMAAGTRTSAEFFADREQARRIKKEHGILESWEEKLEIHVDRELKDCLLGRQMTGQQTSEQIRKEQAGSKAGRTGQSTYQNNGRSEKCIRRRSGAGRLAGRNPGTRRL